MTEITGFRLLASNQPSSLILGNIIHKNHNSKNPHPLISFRPAQRTTAQSCLLESLSRILSRSVPIRLKKGSPTQVMLICVGVGVSLAVFAHGLTYIQLRIMTRTQKSKRVSMLAVEESRFILPGPFPPAPFPTDKSSFFPNSFLFHLLSQYVDSCAIIPA